MTIREAADIIGLGTYDTALPQAWVDGVRVKLGAWVEYGEICSNFVWAYDELFRHGRPCALTVRGNEILARLNAWDGTSLPLTERPVDGAAAVLARLPAELRLELQGTAADCSECVDAVSLPGVARRYCAALTTLEQVRLELGLWPRWVEEHPFAKLYAAIAARLSLGVEIDSGVFAAIYTAVQEWRGS